MAVVAETHGCSWLIVERSPKQDIISLLLRLIVNIVNIVKEGVERMQESEDREKGYGMLSSGNSTVL